MVVDPRVSFLLLMFGATRIVESATLDNLCQHAPLPVGLDGNIMRLQDFCQYAEPSVLYALI